MEEADDPSRLLKRLNQPIQQNAVETTIMPMDAVPVVLVERVHDRPRLQYQQRDTSGYPPSLTMASPLISRDRPRPPRHARAQGISRAKPLASLSRLAQLPVFRVKSVVGTYVRST